MSRSHWLALAWPMQNQTLFIHKHTHLCKSLPQSSPHKTLIFIKFPIFSFTSLPQIQLRKLNHQFHNLTFLSLVGDCYLPSKPKAMSPSQFHSKKEITSTNNKNTNGLLPPPLKINRESHFIKKSSSSPPQSSSSSSSSISSSLVNAMTQGMPTQGILSRPQQQRHPVIIYTHSPKVIHTQPKDFMSLVQKLTGLSHSDEEEEDDDNLPPQQPSKQESGGVIGDKESDRESVIVVRNEENEASSVITEENNCSSSMGENQVNSCFMAGEGPMLEPPLNPYVTMLPPSSAKFVCSSQPLMNYSDSLFFSHNLRTSIPSSATFEGRKEFREH